MSDPLPTPRPWLDRLIRRRHLCLGLFVIGVGIGIWDLWVAPDSIVLREGSLHRLDWTGNLTLIAILLLAPALFLLGAPHLRWPRATRKRWIGISIIVGALWASLLCAGIGAALLSLGLRINSDQSLLVAQKLDPWLILIVWIAWLVLFTLVWAGEWIVVFRRLYRLLLAGTFLELLITIPIDIQVRRQTRCYCGEGSFLALVIGLTMAFWTFGPGVVLLYLARRMQRFDASRCSVCGYDLQGSPGDRCSECGSKIPRRSTRSEVS